MKSLLKKILKIRFPDFTIPLMFLVVCLLSYSLLIKYLGFYWDDWPLTWISQKLGPEALSLYFHTNRPVWGLIYQITTPLVGHQPWAWHLFGVFWRWVSVLSLYWLLRLLWPEKRQPAVWVCLLWAVYPGASQQFIPLIFGHFFVVLSAFFASMALTLLALRKHKYFWWLTLAAFLLSLVNLLTLEYFFVLELIRFALLWLVLYESKQKFWPVVKKTLLNWIPYLLALLAAASWRLFFFEYQTTNYQPKFLATLKINPLLAVRELLQTMLHDIWVSTFAAWAQVFQLPDPAELGRITTLFFAVLVLLSIFALFIYLLGLKSNALEQNDKKVWAWQALGLGVLGLVLAGWPYWMVDLPMSLGFPNSRITLSFMTGVSFLIAGLLGLLPGPRWTKLFILSTLVGLAVGFQFRTANTFRRDWTLQNTLFWQMSWRIPQMEEGSTLLVNDMPLHFSTDNSLSGALNWVYAKEDQPETMPYILYYPSLRYGGGLPSFEPDQELYVDYLAIKFYGNTSQMLGIYYDPPACFRVLDPDLDPYNLLLTEQMREAARTSKPDMLIRSESEPVQLQEDIFGQEPAHGWCYYFEKADLARQREDWGAVVSLGDEAFTSGDYPNDPFERVPFIEGYAHTDNWQRAAELTLETYRVSNLTQPLLCKLWERIESETPQGQTKTDTIFFLRSELGCSE